LFAASGSRGVGNSSSSSGSSSGSGSDTIPPSSFLHSPPSLDTPLRQELFDDIKVRGALPLAGAALLKKLNINSVLNPISLLNPNLFPTSRRTALMTSLDWMKRCLTDPLHGYYCTKQHVSAARPRPMSRVTGVFQILGAQGDFTTSPEISQLFGDIVGLWCAS
jgi:hypothetical protein